jgi:hypothetical protein
MLRALIVGLLACTLAGEAVAQVEPSAPATQDPPAPTPQEPPVTQLDDIVVTPERLEELAQEFVDSLAAPARGRGLARWESKVCLGVVNFRTPVAHQLIDHISAVAEDVGVMLDEPGCAPNVLIIGTADGQALASSMVDRHRRQFRYGYTRSNRGSRALEVFRTSEAPIRWWHISLLINTENGAVAMRLPGQGYASVPAGCPQRLGGVRRCNEVTDRLMRAVIIVDVNALPEVTFSQIGDYLSVLALAQVEPDTDYAGFPTVLNLLADPQNVAGLTDWDRNYLRALYAGESERIDPEEQAQALAEQMRGGSSD